MAARARETRGERPRARDLFRGERRAASRCARRRRARSALSGWWLFQFWQSQHLRRLLVDAGTDAGEVTRIVSASFFVRERDGDRGQLLRRVAGARDRQPAGDRACSSPGSASGSSAAFIVPRSINSLACCWFPLAGFFSGVFALFTMYLPPLFPTLLRTTGAGFCYNIGRVAAAVCTLVFGLLAPVNDYREALLWAGALALVAAAWSWRLPDETAMRE